MLGLTEEQLALRRTLITASEVPMILGYSKWGQGHTVWARKHGLVEDQPMSPAMEWGHRLEAAVLAKYVEQHGVDEVRLDGTMLGPCGVIGATPDAIVGLDGDRWCVQVKTARVKTSDWGEDGSPQVPIAYWIQVQIEMYVTGLQRCDIAVLFGGSDYQEHPIARDQRWLDATVPLLQEWHERHIVKKEVPAVDYEAAHAIDVLRDIHPVSDGTIIVPMGDQLKKATSAFGDYRHHLIALEGNQAMVDAAKARLCDLIGDAEGLDMGSHIVRWKAVRDSTRVDHKAYAAALEALVDPEQAKQLRAQHMTTTPGTRRFTVTERKSG